jgi:hypothetical protein
VHVQHTAYIYDAGCAVLHLRNYNTVIITIIHVIIISIINIIAICTAQE